MTKGCLVVGCLGEHKARGYCSRHYQLWRLHGNPLGVGRTSRGATTSFLHEVVIPFLGSDCLIWPFSRDKDGYGKMWDGNTVRLVHSIVCETVYGPKPTEKHEVAHSCGCGHEGCVNPRHLRWATPSENNLDKIKHGTMMRGKGHTATTLSEEDVLQIMALRGLHTQVELGEMFGVNHRTISQIHLGTRWGWLTNAGERSV